MSVSSDMRVNASRSRDRARAGAMAMLAGVLDALGRAIAIDSHAPQARRDAAVPIVDDGAAVSRPCQGMDVPVPLRRQPAGRLRPGARQIEFDQSHIAIPRPRYTHSEESQETYARRRPSGEKAGFVSTRFDFETISGRAAPPSTETR